MSFAEIDYWPRVHFGISRMRIFPATGTEWSDVALAPFKTFPIVVFLIAGVWKNELCGEPMIGFILFGFVICLLFVAWAAAVDTFAVKSTTTNWR